MILAPDGTEADFVTEADLRNADQTAARALSRELREWLITRGTPAERILATAQVLGATVGWRCTAPEDTAWLIALAEASRFYLAAKDNKEKCRSGSDPATEL